MGLDYRLILAGAPALDEVAAVTSLHPAELPTTTSSPRLLSADLNDLRGYALSVHSGTNGCYWAEGDDEPPWEWEPASYMNVTFDMRKDQLVDKGIPNMVATVARVLAARDEDAALVQNGESLLLTRTAGRIRKHRRRQWWEHYGLDALVG